jgi:predicted nuclease of predicted toxin-antitoxin system
MKLLLDQNFSYKLLKPLSKIYEEVAQISRIGMGQTSDSMIWQHALTNEYTIVSRDAYFAEKNALTGYPIKVIWVKCQDISTENILNILTDQYEAIMQFYHDEAKFCLELIDTVEDDLSL